MMMPSIFGENLFDDFMDDFSRGFEFPEFSDFSDVDKKLYGKHAKNLMKTDVKDTENGYEVSMDLPGFKKDEIKMKLENGVLTINAAKGLDKDEKDKKGKYVRRERYAGSLTRSFYVGEGIHQEDIKAKLADGVLTLLVPKEKEEVNQKKYIEIE